MTEKFKDLTWQVLSRRYLDHAPWHTVRADEVKLPTGKIIPDYYVLEYPDWVGILPVTCSGKIVMVRQYRHGIGRTCFELPAGAVERSDASFMDAARRELGEETGYGKGKWQLYSTISANPATHNNLTHVYLATDVEEISAPHLDEGEALTVHLFTPAEVFDLLRRGEILQSLMYGPLWKFFFEHRDLTTGQGD